MPPKKKEPSLEETVQDTITLIESLLEKPDYTTIRQLGWNLGWHNNIYHLEIIEDPLYDDQALILAEKILRQILEPPQEEPQ